MAKTETIQQQQQQQNMDNIPPAGYPTLSTPEGKMKKKGLFRTKQKGEKGFIEGCGEVDIVKAKKFNKATNNHKQNDAYIAITLCYLFEVLGAPLPPYEKSKWRCGG
ncbi:hypothetical protein KSS87_005931 [Heliosperma pusillum]|nr:hypothetical protein KSS87_005931 [Heliosperma pusillum]